MQSAAVLLLLTLTVPSITTIVCDLACARHEHHSAETAMGHDHAHSQDEAAVAGGTAVVCHDQAAIFTTIVAESRVLIAAPAATQLPPALLVHHSHLSPVERREPFAPPGTVLQTIQLRI